MRLDGCVVTKWLMNRCETIPCTVNLVRDDQAEAASRELYLVEFGGEFGVKMEDDAERQMAYEQQREVENDRIMKAEELLKGENKALIKEDQNQKEEDELEMEVLEQEDMPVEGEGGVSMPVEEEEEQVGLSMQVEECGGVLMKMEEEGDVPKSEGHQEDSVLEASGLTEGHEAAEVADSSGLSDGYQAVEMEEQGDVPKSEGHQGDSLVEPSGPTESHEAAEVAVEMEEQDDVAKSEGRHGDGVVEQSGWHKVAEVAEGIQCVGRVQSRGLNRMVTYGFERYIDAFGIPANLAFNELAREKEKLRQFKEKMTEAASIIDHDVEVKEGEEKVVNLWIQCSFCNHRELTLEKISDHLKCHGHFKPDDEDRHFFLVNQMRKKIHLKFSLKSE